MKKIGFIVFLFVVNFSITIGQQYNASWKSLDSRPIPSWFQDAKFGIFIHWGVYSVPAWRKVESARYASYAEWYYARVMDNKNNGGYNFHRENYGDDFEYRDFANIFKAELYNPDQWAELFKKSGAKYVVLTSKHHDGYCMWPTTNKHKENWNVGDIGPNRDLLGELTTSVRNKGLKMGLYYSIPDWESVPKKENPKEYLVREEFVEKYGLDPQKYRDEILLPQLEELVTKYKPSLIFSDAGEWTYGEEFWKTKQFLAWLYNQPSCKDDVVVNDRWCKGMPGKHGDYFSSEYNDADASTFSRPWEESRGIGGSYGFNRAENAEDYSSAAELIVELIDIVSSGGNLLLNVGPTSDGRIPVVMQERLIEIGKWLDINGDAIYGTRAIYSNHLESKDQNLFFTKKKEHYYCLFSEWNSEIEINISKGEQIKQISLLGYEGEIEWRQSGQILKIKVPRLTVNELPCNHAWALRLDK